MKKYILFALILFTGTSSWANDGEVTPYDATIVADDYNCSKYGPDSVKAIQYYSLYREYYKQENYEEAMKYWPYVYENAPALHKNVIRNGIEYQKKLIKEEEDQAVKNELVNKLMSLYDHRIACHGDEASYTAKKGFDLLKYTKDRKDEVKVIFGKAIELGGDETPYHVLNAYFSMVINDLNKKIISAEEALEIKDQLKNICDANADHVKYAEKYAGALAKIEKTFETVGGSLFDCNAMKELWKKEYDANPNDVDAIRGFISQMSKCKSDPFYSELDVQLFKLAPTSNGYMRKASDQMRVKEYSAAIPLIELAISLESDPIKISDWNYKISELQYAMKDYPAARTYARKSMEGRPNWGKPYLLIGKLYASSGNTCNPDGHTGFNSQRVIWPALDKFKKAKAVDDSVAEEAQALINKYWSYLPEKAELFMMGHNEGASYFVPCWIQESTTIRAK